MTLRAGVVGLGVMGRHHSRVLSQLDGVEFVGVSDPADSIGPSIQGKPVFKDLSAFLDQGVDYCVVSAPTTYHLSIARELAERGIHALVEKPVASSAAEAIELRDLFASKNLVGGVGHIERYNPALQSARQRIEDGLIGEIYQVVTRRQGPFPGRIADVGVIKDLASHDIDLTAWVTQQDYVNVNARTAHRSGRAHEDMVVAVGTLTNGAIVSHTVNWLTPFKERVTILTGEKGVLVADTLTADLTFYQNGVIEQTWDGSASFRGVSEGDMVRFALNRREPLLAEHEAFRDAVLLGDQSKIVTFAEGTRVVEIAEALVADGLKHRQS
jgi:UDP-N-acetylglucosamine 3-dehydrogenase